MPDADQPARVIRIERDLPWLPSGSVCRTMLSPILPPRALITMAAVFAFDKDRLLLVDLVERGWDIPGGHLEGQEPPEEAVRREAREEAGARLGQLHVLAHNQVTIADSPPLGHPYPHPVSYIVFYLSQLTGLEPFIPTPESRGGALFDPPGARALPWVQHHRELYEAALRPQRA